MMERKGNLMSFRPDIRVFDATIRDGGLVNSFRFSDDFVRELYLSNIKSGVDYMEFGYKADEDIFNREEFGDWKFCDEAAIRRIVGENKTDLKLAVMADVGRCNLQRDLLPRSESVIDMVRIATYIHTMPAAIEMIEYCHKLGYETTCNIMAISKTNTADIDEALAMLCQSSVDVIYLVDSYGSLFPEQIQKLSRQYLDHAEKAGKKIGMHAHNNQQLAFANTIEACSMGVSFLDATVGCMGRGAGNCAMELLLGFLKNPKYHLTPIIKFYEDYIMPLKAEGNVWGYDIQYLLTGQLNQHPSSAISFTADKRTDYTSFYHTIYDLDKE